MFNPYSVYTYTANEMQSACDDKILVDLRRLKSFTEFDDVDEYINKTFGNFTEQKVFDYPNNIQVIIQREENLILVGAMQNENQIFGRGWRYHPPEEDE